MATKAKVKSVHIGNPTAHLGSTVKLVRCACA